MAWPIRSVMPCRCFAAASWRNGLGSSQSCSLQACRPRSHRRETPPAGAARWPSQYHALRFTPVAWSHAAVVIHLGVQRPADQSWRASTTESMGAAPNQVAAGPVGPPVEPLPSGRAPGRAPLQGRYVRLEPVDVPAHAPSLYALSHARPKTPRSGPTWPTARLRTRMRSRAGWPGASAPDDPLFFAIIEQASGQASGMASYLNIVPDMGCIEIGHIWFAPPLQKTRRDRGDLPDDAPRVRRPRLSPPGGSAMPERGLDARRAPLRLHLRGHVPPAHGGQGAQPRHRLVRLLDREWPAVRAAFERWLAPRISTRMADSGCRLPRSCQERDRFEGTPQCTVTLSVL